MFYIAKINGKIIHICFINLSVLLKDYRKDCRKIFCNILAQYGLYLVNI